MSSLPSAPLRRDEKFAYVTLPCTDRVSLCMTTSGRRNSLWPIAQSHLPRVCSLTDLPCGLRVGSRRRHCGMLLVPPTRPPDIFSPVRQTLPLSPRVLEQLPKMLPHMRVNFHLPAQLLITESARVLFHRLRKHLTLEAGAVLRATASDPAFLHVLTAALHRSKASAADQTHVVHHQTSYAMYPPMCDTHVSGHRLLSTHISTWNPVFHVFTLMLVPVAWHTCTAEPRTRKGP